MIYCRWLDSFTCLQYSPIVVWLRYLVLIWLCLYICYSQPIMLYNLVASFSLLFSQKYWLAFTKVAYFSNYTVYFRLSKADQLGHKFHLLSDPWTCDNLLSRLVTLCSLFLAVILKLLFLDTEERVPLTFLCQYHIL